MSSSSKSESDNTFDIEELLQLGTRCQELKKEKDMFKESRSQGFELIGRLEVHLKSLSEARKTDRKHIEKLETELLNCSQEIDYLQDQLNVRNAEVNYLTEHLHTLNVKLLEMETLQETIGILKDELKWSGADCLQLEHEVDEKEVKLKKSSFQIEKLEESISSIALESQCEIESMKLDIMALEQSCFEANKLQEVTIEENIRLARLLSELEIRYQDSQETIKCLDNENKELREKVELTEMKATEYCRKIKELMENKERSLVNTESTFSELDYSSTLPKEVSGDKEILNLVLSKHSVILEQDADLRVLMEKMQNQICQYELIIKQLKEELREEKLKAKEEAEDLAQEMAELRYQMTCLLEEERKRRASVEQGSLQRIAELEAQVKREKRKPITVFTPQEA